MTSRVHPQQSVLGGDRMERGSLLVSEECIWNPDASPAIVTKAKLIGSALTWTEDQSWVPPRLTQVHVDRVVLQRIGRPVVQ